MHLIRSPADWRSVSAKRGHVETPMIADLDLTESSKRISLGRVGEAEEIARVIAFLLCDDSSYITGSVQVVDGGWLC